MADEPTVGSSPRLRKLLIKSHPEPRMGRPCPCDMRLDNCDCRARTFELLIREKTLEKITFLVPRRYCIWQLDDIYGEKIYPQGFLPKVSVVVEPAAFLGFSLTVEDFTNQGVRETSLPLSSTWGAITMWTKAKLI